MLWNGSVIQLSDYALHDILKFVVWNVPKHLKTAWEWHRRLFQTQL